MKRLTIKQRYSKAYRNYLRRANRGIRKGYNIQPIPRVKKPTLASIRRLERQTAKEFKKKDIIDYLTGELVRSQKRKKEIEKTNLEFLKLTPEEQALSRQAGEIIRIEQATEPLGARDTYELLIENWYRRIETYRSDIYRYLESKTNEILVGADKETRKKFAFALDNNPEVFPQEGDSDRAVIDLKFDRIRQIMSWAEDSEAYQDFLKMFDIVEDEE